MQLDEVINDIILQIEFLSEERNLGLEYSIEFREISGWDSFRQVQLIAWLQEKYNIKIPFSDVRKLTTIQNMANYVLNYHN